MRATEEAMISYRNEEECPQGCGPLKRADVHVYDCAQCGERKHRAPPPFQRITEEHVRKLWGLLAKHRERYVRAWVAATGIDPRDAVLVEQQHADGSVSIRVVHKSEAPQ
jgi:hypothetical protein